MTSIYVVDSMNQYRAIRSMYGSWITDISSEEFESSFEDYWNRRVDSPVIHSAPDFTRLRVRANGRIYCLPIQLTFRSDEERTFWLLQNS